MVLRRACSILVCVALAAGLACSGSSSGDDHGDDDDSAGAANAGETGSGGSSGKGGKGGAGGTSVTGGTAGSSNEAGGGNVGPMGGVAGVTGVAGTGGSAGAAAIGGFSGTAGTGPMPPMGWTCTPLVYENGACDCGCGAPDPDCDHHDDVSECALCNSFGSCNLKACPGDIDRADTTICRPPPEGWTCSVSAYEDGISCDCGCGIADPDCEGEGVEACHVCDLFGSCAGGNCPSSIDEDDNTQCNVPEGWTCRSDQYADGACHCGCGVLDSDCASASSSECDVCSSGCSNEFCPGPIDADDNTICTGAPNTWSCDRAFYRDGSQCHCGCGALDPDCASEALEACERCNFEGSCSARACPGTIDPEDIAHCARPDPPAEWTCDSYLYADGFQCDCGCGALDLDCPTADIDRCDACYGCGSNLCPGRVDPSDIGQCVPPPDGWTCDALEYADGYTCNCGCGVLDPDCESASWSSCSFCSKDNGGCTYDCSDLDPDDNSRCADAAPPEWTCHQAYYSDQVCDCGCGALDADCTGPAPSACASCDAPGSCAEGDCDTIDAENNALCVAAAP